MRILTYISHLYVTEICIGSWIRVRRDLAKKFPFQKTLSARNEVFVEEQNFGYSGFYDENIIERRRIRILKNIQTGQLRPYRVSMVNMHEWYLRLLKIKFATADIHYLPANFVFPSSQMYSIELRKIEFAKAITSTCWIANLILEVAQDVGVLSLH